MKCFEYQAIVAICEKGPIHGVQCPITSFVNAHRRRFLTLQGLLTPFVNNTRQATVPFYKHASRRTNYEIKYKVFVSLYKLCPGFLISGHILCHVMYGVLWIAMYLERKTFWLIELGKRSLSFVNIHESGIDMEYKVLKPFLMPS